LQLLPNIHLKIKRMNLSLFDIFDEFG
jgi:hypothetical protein